MDTANKSVYKMTFNADRAAVEKMLQDFLVGHEFTYQPKENANYYMFNDPLVSGKKGFEYYINGSELTVLAYLGKYEKPKSLEGVIGALVKQAYKSQLETLFKEIASLGTGQQMPPASAAVSGQASPVQTGQQMPPVLSTSTPDNNKFMEENMKKKELWTTVAFIVSVIGLFLSFFGVTFGYIIIIFEIIFAIKGLKTRRRGLAIATIVLAVLSSVIIIATLFLSAMMMN